MLFFERQKTLRNEWPSVLRRDIFPVSVRVQCWQIVERFSGGRSYHASDKFYELCSRVSAQMCHSLGVMELPVKDEVRHYNASDKERLHTYLIELSEKNKTEIEYALSIIELFAVHIAEVFRGQNLNRLVEAINFRLRLGGVGYKIIDRQLVPVDDDHLTETAVIPAISLLNRPEFEAAYKYLHQAYLDYRGGSDKSLENAIDNTVKAGESLLKHIFDKLGIPHGPKDTFQPLIQKAKENGLFAEIEDDKLAPLTNALKAVGSLRNKKSGHGAPDRKATDKLVRLALHHATANMLFIAESYLEHPDCPGKIRP